MINIGFTLFLIGMLSAFVFFVLTFITLINKKGNLKKRLLGAGISLASIVVGLIIVIVTPYPSPSESSKATEAEAADSPVEETVDSSSAEEVVEETEEVEELPVEDTPQVKMINQLTQLMDEGLAFDAGSYIQGDIPKGEYAFIPFSGGGQYYSEEDQAGNIVDNENFDSFGYVFVQEVGNLKTDGVLVNVSMLESLGVAGAKELYEIVNEQSDYLAAGYYKVGTDIEPGKYVIESYGDAYVALMTGPVGNSDIVDNENFNGKYSVNAQTGQYLTISRGMIIE